MQVEPQGAGVGQLVLARPDGGELALDVGRQVVARVVDSDPAAGTARINLAGQTVTVQTAIPVARGDVLNLTVTQNEGGAVSLSIQQAAAGTGASVPALPSALPAATNAVPSPTSPFPQVARQLSEFAPAAIEALARNGVAVTPDAVQALAKAIEQSVTGGSTTQSAARAFAALAGRGIDLDPSVAARVATAIDTSGTFGKELASLAGRDANVAAALGGKVPTGDSLRSLLTPNLSTLEQGLARIANAVATAQGATPGAGTLASAATPASAAPTVATATVASNVAATAALDDLAQQAGGAAQQAKAAQGTQVNGQQLGQQVNAAKLPPTQVGAPNPLLAAAAEAADAPPPAPTALDTLARNAASSDSRSAQAQQIVRANVGAQAGASAATAAGTSTPAPLAQAMVDLGIGMSRFAAAIAPNEGAIGQAAAQVARPGVGQEAAIAGSFIPIAEGGTGAGDNAKLIAAVRGALLDALGAQGEQGVQAGKLIDAALAGSAKATAQLTELLARSSQGAGLLAAGKLLEALPGLIASGVSPAHAAELRELARKVLNQAGLDGLPPVDRDTLALRAALERAASSGATQDVRDDSLRLLHALDGQQILSHPKAGMDPGYIYFQLPLPGDRQAEVLVRREPGQRAVSFEQFDIAFLLDTESLGSLMVHLDAHPAAVRATIKTDRPEFMPLLEAQAQDLAGPLEREAGRPVSVNIGTFGADGPPATLLEPQLGFIPGENAFYA